MARPVQQRTGSPLSPAYAGLPPDRLDQLRDWLQFGLPGQQPTAVPPPGRPRPLRRRQEAA